MELTSDPWFVATSSVVSLPGVICLCDGLNSSSALERLRGDDSLDFVGIIILKSSGNCSSSWSEHSEAEEDVMPWRWDFCEKTSSENLHIRTELW